MTWEMTWEMIDSVVSTWFDLFSPNTIPSSSVFRNWFGWIAKSCGMWFLDHWYWFVGVIACYIAFVVGYRLMWSYLLNHIQKKNAN